MASLPKMGSLKPRVKQDILDATDIGLSSLFIEDNWFKLLHQDNFLFFRNSNITLMRMEAWNTFPVRIMYQYTGHQPKSQLVYTVA